MPSRNGGRECAGLGRWVVNGGEECAVPSRAFSATPPPASHAPVVGITYIGWVVCFGIITGSLHNRFWDV